MTGTFRFFGVDAARLAGKERQAFRAGFLGIESFGWSTLVVVTEATPRERAAAVERLAEQLVARCGAPDIGTARAAAEEEVAFAESLCDHPPDTLLGLQRAAEGETVRESFRTLHRRASRIEPIGAFRFVEVEEEAPGRGRGPRRAGAKGAAMRDFWVASGHHLLDRDEAGRLRVTDAFLKAYLARPELVPPEDACEAELRLHHELLMHHPRRPVGDDEIAAMEDADARENWRYMIAFRDRLLAAPSLDAAYLALARGAAGDTPPLFMDQLAQVVLRSALDGERDPWVLRAAELFYRPQRVSFHEGAMLLADAETIELHEEDRHASPLLAMLGGPAVSRARRPRRGERRGVFRPERRLRHGAGLRHGQRGPPRPGGGDGGLDTASPGRRGGDRAGGPDRGRDLGVVRRPRRRGDADRQRALERPSARRRSGRSRSWRSFA